MKIPMAFLADEANISQEGKLNVLGIFDRIAADEFPVTHPRLVFCFRVEAEYGDAGRIFPVQVRLVDEDGDALFEASGEIGAPSVTPGELSSANQLFALAGVQFPRPGTYRFVVTLGASYTHETPFVVGARPDPSALN